jgi:hypothetical protein
METVILLLKRIPLLEIAILASISIYILLFNPYGIIGKLKMEAFIEKYQIFFGVIFIVSIAYIFIQIIKKIYKLLNMLFRYIYLNKSLNDLTKEELAFLVKYFYNRDVKDFILSAYAPISNGYTSLLSKKGIIYYSGGASALLEFVDSNPCFPYNLNKRAYTYLKCKFKY